VSAKSSEMNVMIPAGEDFVEQVTFYAFRFMSFKMFFWFCLKAFARKNCYLISFGSLLFSLIFTVCTVTVLQSKSLLGFVLNCL
jgi:hypothetical protein